MDANTFCLLIYPVLALLHLFFMCPYLNKKTHRWWWADIKICTLFLFGQKWKYIRRGGRLGQPKIRAEGERGSPLQHPGQHPQSSQPKQTKGTSMHSLKVVIEIAFVLGDSGIGRSIPCYACDFVEHCQHLLFVCWFINISLFSLCWLMNIATARWSHRDISQYEA